MSAAPPSAPATRQRWMDALRGYAIIAVVFHHAVDAAAWHRSGLPTFFTTLDAMLSPFRIPLLMFLSGMLLHKSLAKSARPYFTAKARRILWPYLVWTTTALLLVGELRTYTDGVLILLPVTHVWYLWALILYYCMAFVLRRAPALVWLLSVTAAIVAAQFVDQQRILYLWPMFVFGYLYAMSGRVPEFVGLWWVRLSLAVVAALAIVMSARGGHVQYDTTFMAAVLAGVLLVARPFEVAATARWSRAINYIGTHSLMFYCVHWCAIGLLANEMNRLGRDQPTVVMVATLIFGLGVSWLFTLGADRWRSIDALFTFPSVRRTPAQDGSGARRVGSAHSFV